jgi:hypothetical protein
VPVGYSNFKSKRDIELKVSQEIELAMKNKSMYVAHES